MPHHARPLRRIRKLTRRDMLRLGGTAAAGAAVLGCGSGDDGRPVTVFSPMGEVKNQALVRQVDRFMALRDDLRVEVMPVPWDQGHAKLLTMIAGGNPPDVITATGQWMAEFRAMGAIEDLTSWHASWPHRDAFTRTALLRCESSTAIEERPGLRPAPGADDAGHVLPPAVAGRAGTGTCGDAGRLARFAGADHRPGPGPLRLRPAWRPRGLLDLVAHPGGVLRYERMVRRGPALHHQQPGTRGRAGLLERSLPGRAGACGRGELGIQRTGAGILVRDLRVHRAGPGSGAHLPGSRHGRIDPGHGAHARRAPGPRGLQRHLDPVDFQGGARTPTAPWRSTNG